jgi:dimethylglycine catabolism A
MWRSPTARKHSLPLLEAPTAEVAAQARWFQPIAVGPRTLATRTWIPAMVPWRATDDGFVTDRVLAWYRRFAEGRPGAIVVEATGIRDVPSGPLLRIGDDRFVPGLAALADVVRQASGGETRLFLQILDFLRIRRRPAREAFLGRHLVLTDAHRAAAGSDDDAEVRAWLLAKDDDALAGILGERDHEALTRGARERIGDPHLADLPAVLPGLHAAAARRAETAGFDGVELHFAHAYTMASFLSARNDRRDGYGGSRQGRARLPVEVIEATRAATRFVVGARILTDEIIDGGSTLDDSVALAPILAAAGLDFLSLSRGGKFEDAKPPKVGWSAYPYTGRSGWECMPTIYADDPGPFGRNVAAAGAVRSALHAAGWPIPVVVAGGITSFSQAEAILAAGQADIVGAARQSLADPDWWRKLRLGRGAEIRRCSYTNYCEGLDQMHKTVTCRLWDHEAVGGADVSDDGRRRLVAPPWEV